MKSNDRSKPTRIGELLASRGVLTPVQIDQVLDAQKDSGRPFGDLAERMFGVEPRDVERAWLDQYLTYDTTVDLDAELFDPTLTGLLNRRQAWQFRVLPVRRENHELVIATTAHQLRKAVNFAWRTFNEPVFFLVAPRVQLEQHLMEHYPWPGAQALTA